jgi:NAD(P)-dependent dehydrogenase (short-subunit alcohol dehydrogenase family)
MWLWMSMPRLRGGWHLAQRVADGCAAPASEPGAGRRRRGRSGTAARVVETALSRFDRVDLLVNSAGIFVARPFLDHTDDDFARLVSTNLGGFFHMTRAALRPMVAQGSGHIVNISTSLVVQPNAGVPGALSIATKGGIEAAARALAIEYVSHGIRVNTVAAGAIDTPMTAGADRAALKRMAPMNRIGTAQEIAGAILYLESAAFVTGEVVHVDGGAHAGKW